MRIIFTLFGIISCFSFHQCLVVVTAPVVTPDSIDFHCEEGWIKEGGHCYWPVDNPASFIIARANCRRLSARLVNIRDESENDFVYGLAKEKSFKKIWIDNFEVCKAFGLYDLFEPKSQSFQFLDSTPDSNNECMSQNENGKWEVTNCLERHPYLCRTLACVEGGYRCHDITGCISKKWVCDGERDCRISGSDEQNCPNQCRFEETGISGEIVVNPSNHYTNDADCMWTIIGPVGKQIKVSIENFDTEEHRDFVYITDVTNVRESVMLSGQQSNQDYFMASNKARVSFKADSSVVKTGFKIKWTSELPELNSGIMELTATSEWQELTSPFYPNTPKYFNSEWLIKTDEGEVIFFELKEFIKDMDVETEWKLTIFDGEELSSENTRIITTGQADEEHFNRVVTTKSNILRIILYFNAEMPPGPTGFKLSYSKGSDLNLAQSKGTILSPGYFKSEYPPSKSITWTIRDPENTGRPYTINIKNFQLADTVDNVMISDPDSLSTTHHPTGGYMGTVSDETKTIGTQFIVKFTSNLIQSEGRFMIEYSLGCENIPTASNLAISNTTTIPGSTVTISCEAGYSFAQAEYNDETVVEFECMEGGKWNKDVFPTCQEIYCGVPDPIQNGYITNFTGGVKSGDQVEFTCYDGFQLTTQTSWVTCGNNGQYQDDVSCEASTCGGAPNVLNAVVNSEGNSFASVASYECKAGYDLIGSAVLVCLTTGTWSHNAPECIKKKCGIPRFEHATTDTTAAVDFEDKVAYECEEGYVLNGTDEITCGSDQRFDANISCVDENECDEGMPCNAESDCINTIGSYRCQCKPGFETSGSTCIDIDECNKKIDGCTDICSNIPGSYECSCNEGYFLFSMDGDYGNMKSDKETGLRLGDVLRFDHTCVPAICDRPDDIENGTILSSRLKFKFEEKISFQCDLGFKLVGLAESGCGSDGEWTNEPPTCSKITCDTLELKGSTESQDLISKYYGRNDEPTDFGESVIIECDSKVNKSLYCAYNVEDGSYELLGDEPECPIIDCGPVLDIPGAKTPTITNTFVNTMFEFECMDSFNLLGTSDMESMSTNVLCDETGRWRYGNLTCSGASCTDPGTRGNAVQITEGYGIGQTVTYECMTQGYTPHPHTTLECVGAGTWNDTTPICKDTTPPEFTDCPSAPIEVNLLEEITLMVPTATDNSGFVSVSVSPDIGMKAWFLEDKNITYTATDGENNEIECIVEYKVINANMKPVLTCPESLTLDVNDTSSKMMDLKDKITSDGLLTITPETVDYDYSKINTLTQVTAISTGEQGQESQCTFVVNVEASACLEVTLLSPVNAERKCEMNSETLTCTTTCKSGNYFKSGSTTLTSSCTGSAVWSGSDPNEDCVVPQTPVYRYSLKLKYSFGTFFKNCKDSFEAGLSSEWTDISSALNRVCKRGFQVYYSFDVDELVVEEVPGEISEADVTTVLRITDTVVDKQKFDDCKDEFDSYFDDIFGYNTSTCGEDVVKSIDILDESGESCSEEGYMLQTMDDGKVFCLPCGQGTFYNSTSETCDECANGEYQDSANQKSCKQCMNAVDSDSPRRFQHHCIENCPPGFSRNAEEICVACPADEFNDGINPCSSCPAGGSTLGIIGVTSETDCKAPCQPGYYSATGFEDCIACPRNFYSEGGAITCTECEQNEITTQSASFSIDNCTLSDACDPNPCVHGTCNYVNHQPICTCTEGFTGRFCDEEIDNCQSNPCWNNGKCKSTTSGYTCECPSERNCKMDLLGDFTTAVSYLVNPSMIDSVDDCLQRCLDMNECFVSTFTTLQDGSYCALYGEVSSDDRVDSGTYKMYNKSCEVTEFFQGTQCEEDLINDCESNPCTEFGYCQDNIDSAKCICVSPAYEQPSCQGKADICADACSEHGTCETFGSIRAICICEPDYTGDKCETEIKQCEDNPNGCLYNGTCMETPGTPGYTCECKGGFTGDHCEIVPALCQEGSCTNGLCYEDYDNQSPVCICEDLFTNVNGVCQYKDECTNSKCENGAACTSTEGIASCACPNGFEGSLCQHETDECQANPCKNDGICTDLPMEKFNCTCMSGFEGTTCEINIDDRACNTDNTESSKDLVNDYICYCKPGFRGKDCSEVIDECESLPCQHNGICTDGENDYSCECDTGWNGKSCEESVSYCNETVCNAGECISLIDNYFCKCTFGVTGDNCEQSPTVCDKIKPCAPTGTCEDTVGSAKCQCEDGYEGHSCELISGEPCKDVNCNEGTCNKGVCECPTGYTGSMCQLLVDPCLPLNCPASTTCMNPEKPSCVCPDRQVRSDSGCKYSANDFDIFLNYDVPGYKEPTTEYFKINKTTGISIILWAGFIKGQDEKLFQLENSDGYLFFLKSNSVNLKDGPMITLSEGNTFNNKKWNHFAMTISPTGSLEITMNGITLEEQETDIESQLTDYARFKIGENMIGYMSRLRLWNRVLTSTEILESYNNPDDIPDPDLAFDWKELPNSRFQTRMSPSKIQDTSKPIYLCENGVYNEKCTDKINKVPPTGCISESITEVPFPTSERSILITEVKTPPPISGGILYIMNSSSGVVLPMGSHDVVYVGKDEDDNHVTCRYRAHIKSPRVECASSPVTSTMASGSCADTGFSQLCSTADHRPSIPTPNVYTCGKLGSYNGLDWRTPTTVPPCGAVTEVQMTVTAVIPYDMIIPCNTQHETSLKQKIEQKIRELGGVWSGLCTAGCTNIEVIVRCNVNENNRVTVTFTINSLPSMITNANTNVELSPVDILKLSILDSEDFDMTDVGGAEIQTVDVMINGEGFCPTGKTYLNNACISCGPGSFYNASTKKCEVCDYGFYQSGTEQTSCTACPDEETTLAKASTEITKCVEKCEPGNFLDGDSCAECPKDFYQPEEGKDMCIPCPLTKRTRGNGTIDAASCVDDCPDGYEISSTEPGECVICEQDHYRAASIDDVCMLCPDGKVSIDKGAKSAGECKITGCDPGSYFDVDDDFCKDCPFGKYQPEKWKIECMTCPSDTSTRTTGSSSLSDCEFACLAGKEQKDLNVDECTPCERGYYKQDGNAFVNCTKCEESKTTVGTGSTTPESCNITICNAGSRRFPENNTCSECPVGFYQEKDLQDSCDECPEKTSTESTGSDNKTLCLFYCGAGQQIKSGEEACEDCPRGTYKSESNPFGSCVECSDGTTTEDVGSTSDSDCSLPKCDKGQFIMDGACEDCVVDTYQPLDMPKLNTNCSQCPTATGTENVGSESEQDCKRFCEAGEQYNPETMECEQCLQGFYKPAGTVQDRFNNCTKCPDDDFTTVNNGSTQSTDCNLRDCPPGQKIVNTNDCEVCPFGTYQPLRHQLDCISCIENENTSSTGSINKDSCQIYCPAGQQEVELSCTLCPPDTFKPKAGYDTCEPCTGDLTSNNDRLTCDVLFCGTGKQEDNGACEPCLKGSYKDVRGNTECKACPANYTTTGRGAESKSDCNELFCEPGFYSKDTSCQPCDVGKYNDGKGATECQMCPSDRTTPSTGSTSTSDCSLAFCAAGQYRESDLVCTNCTYGQYQNMTGSTTCEECPDNTNTTNTGSTSQDHCLVICTSGQYRNDTENVCMACEKGYYQPDVFMDSCIKCPDDFTTATTGSKTEQDCKIICPVGKYRNPTDRDVCTPCSNNTYQDQVGQIKCEACKEGEVTEQIGSTKATDCLPNCEAGEYLVRESRMCEKCPLGEYSTTGGLTTTCSKCETGKTTANNGSTSSADCNLDDCEKGYKREAGGCVECPLGTYQPETSQTTCIDCPTGKTTLIKAGTSDTLCVDDCDPGQEYIISSKQCEACPIGFYKNNDMITCAKCPDGQTTTNTGGKECVTSFVTEAPETPTTRTTFTMVTEFTIIGGCDNGINREQLSGLIVTIIRELITAQARLYSAICSQMNCGNIVTTVNLCIDPDPRKKRATDSKVTAKTVVSDVPVEVESAEATRDTERVLELALYDRSLFEQDMEKNGLRFEELTSITKTQACQDGQYQQNDTCVDCPAGTYYDKVGVKCVDCERGFYQPSTKQMSCTKCPGVKTTAATKSTSVTACVSPCDLDTEYCMNGGSCSSDSGEVECRCPEAYEGEKCQTRKDGQSSLGPILGGAVGGSVALLLVILIIVGCCVRLKNRKSKEKSNGALFPKNEKDYFYPYGSQSSNIGNPIKPISATAMPNPMYLGYRDNWEDVEMDSPAFYDSRNDGFKQNGRHY